MYPYRPVDSAKHQIRLLRLACGQNPQELEGELLLASLKDFRPPRYETISYAWGDPAKSASIGLDNGRLMIPANTAAALRHARLTDQARMLWIDAVCINQQDQVERGEQVAFMYDIYSRSKGNLIHLLDDETDAQHIADLVRRVNAEGAAETDGWRQLKETLWSSAGIIRVDRLKIWPEIDMNGAVSLLRAPWFR